MTVRVLNQGEQAILQNGVTGVAYSLRLYTLDVTAGLTDAQIDELTEADFTQATFTGYAAATVSTGAWTVTQGDPTQAVNVEKHFTSSADQAPQLIWGYYVTRNSDGMAIWFEPLDGPITIETNGDQVDVVPTMTLDDTRGNQMFTGAIVGATTSVLPTGGWLWCDGDAHSRSAYPNLNQVLSDEGYPYGDGDGSTTFNVPDYRQRMVMGVAASGTGSSLGDTGGDIDHVHDLGTASAHAKVSIASGTTDNIWIQRKAVSPNWNATIEGNLAGAGGDTDSRGEGTALAGDTAAANAPFGTANFVIKT